MATVHYAHLGISLDARIGMLCRNGQTVYYVHLENGNDRLYVEHMDAGELQAYLDAQDRGSNVNPWHSLNGGAL